MPSVAAKNNENVIVPGASSIPITAVNMIRLTTRGFVSE
jgi:hypothetical protein